MNNRVDVNGQTLKLGKIKCGQERWGSKLFYKIIDWQLSYETYTWTVHKWKGYSCMFITLANGNLC